MKKFLLFAVILCVNGAQLAMHEGYDDEDLEAAIKASIKSEEERLANLRLENLRLEEERSRRAEQAKSALRPEDVKRLGVNPVAVKTPQERIDSFEAEIEKIERNISEKNQEFDKRRFRLGEEDDKKVERDKLDQKIEGFKEDIEDLKVDIRRILDSNKGLTLRVKESNRTKRRL
jgi:exonuclease VII large subunit